MQLLPPRSSAITVERQVQLPGREAESTVIPSANPRGRFAIVGRAATFGTLTGRARAVVGLAAGYGQTGS